VAKGRPRTSGMGRLVEASQPRASVQGTRMLVMLTPPDSVRRRPMLSQLWANLGLVISSDDRGMKGWLAYCMPSCLVLTKVKMWSSVPSRTPSRTVRSDTTPPVLKFLEPLKTMWSPSDVILRSLSRGLTAPPTNWSEMVRLLGAFVF
jgi:hypothetical protein